MVLTGRSSWLLAVALLTSVLAAGCAPAEDDGRALERIHAAFVEKLPAEPASACPHPLREGALRAYLIAAAEHDVAAARRSLVRVHAQLRCVSAARFVAIHRAFHAAAIGSGAAADPRVAERIAPLAFLLLEMAPASLRLDLLPWFHVQVPYWRAALREGGSFLAALGLWATADANLMLLEGLDLARLLESFGSGAWSSGQCGALAIQRIPVRRGALELTLPLCPADCLLSRSRDGPAVRHQLAGEDVPEVEDYCKDLREMRDALRASGPGRGVARCLGDFADGHRGLMACIGDRARARHGALGWAASADLERSVSIGRRCQVSHGGHGYGRLAWVRVQVDTDPPRRDDRGRPVYNEDQRLVRSWKESVYQDDDGNTVHVYTEERFYDEDSNLVREVHTEVDHEGNGTRTVTDHVGDGTSKTYTEEVTCDDDECRPEGAADSPSHGDCAPDAGTCSEDCGIVDQHMADFLECREASFPQPAPGGGPDPAARPDPTAPVAPGAEAELARCIVSALGAGGAEPITQADCAAWTRCANGEMPRGRECTCLAEQRVREPHSDLCARTLCDPTAPSCPCPEVGGAGRAGPAFPVPPLPRGPEAPRPRITIGGSPR